MNFGLVIETKPHFHDWVDGKFSSKRCSHCRAAVAAGGRVCCSCGRAKGCDDRFGGDGPLPALRRCRCCRRWACSVCESVSECCLGPWEEWRWIDPTFLPPGWERDDRGWMFVGYGDPRYKWPDRRVVEQILNRLAARVRFEHSWSLSTSAYQLERAKALLGVVP